ncbi:hypothetical protein MYSTI_00307 [Myxococcus stipitatus DSM 14675]|uniref:Uncharacterized protein n=1 Tax=Myxococcus stipitatus (strain DSM 14675 / JCM 12634 / Mx s8) TaxID=1278073 RepID=L7U1C5_MYXSD|nr:hypothetical protein [Myxococcus stipitatus]AGC41665.1 hypothetical protein MYSTI_00307 [Myxococcus stipitatus DSM 14675]
MTKVVKEEPVPEALRGRPVGLLDVLRWSREQLLKGRGLWYVAGGDRVDSLVSFIHGWLAHNIFNGGADPAWHQFETWLRDVKGEFPAEGWHVKFLEDCQGDHARAAMKFLDYVEEFATQRGTTG